MTQPYFARMREVITFALVVAVIALWWDDVRQRSDLDQTQKQLQDTSGQLDDIKNQNLALLSALHTPAPAPGPRIVVSPTPNWFEERLNNTGALDLEPPSHRNVAGPQ